MATRGILDAVVEWINNHSVLLIAVPNMKFWAKVSVCGMGALKKNAFIAYELTWASVSPGGDPFRYNL